MPAGARRSRETSDPRRSHQRSLAGNRSVGASRTGSDDWLVLRGQLGMRRQDWDAAYAAWKTHLDRNPSNWNSANAIERLKRVRQLAHASDTHDQTRPTPIAPGVCQGEDVRQLMLNFESIGSDCEFGTVQRRFGAEPLGLLRWSETTLDTLMAALAAKFDSLGDPAYTGLHVSPTLFKEIYLYDTRWYLLMNTFLYEGEVALTALMPKLCRYVAYLRDRFLEDLAVGRKTIVFKSDTITKRELLTPRHVSRVRAGAAVEREACIEFAGFPSRRGRQCERDQGRPLCRSSAAVHHAFGCRLQRLDRHLPDGRAARCDLVHGGLRRRLERAENRRDLLGFKR